MIFFLGCWVVVIKEDKIGSKYYRKSGNRQEDRNFAFDDTF